MVRNTKAALGCALLLTGCDNILFSSSKLPKNFSKFLSTGRPVITFIAVSILLKNLKKKTPTKHAPRLGRHHVSSLCRWSCYWKETHPGRLEQICCMKKWQSLFSSHLVWLPLICVPHIPVSCIGKPKDRMTEKRVFCRSKARKEGSRSTVYLVIWILIFNQT